MEIKELKDLKKEIEKQREINIGLFKLIPLPSREDPMNKKAEPILAEWREAMLKQYAVEKAIQKNREDIITYIEM